MGAKIAGKIQQIAGKILKVFDKDLQMSRCVS
jgi:hypothetical protein